MTRLCLAVNIWSLYKSVSTQKFHRLDHNFSSESCCTVSLVDYQHHLIMDNVTFGQALTRCGITQAIARKAIVDQGYTNMVEFAQLSEKDIQTFVKEVNKLPVVPPAVASPSIPYASIKKLCAMRHWTIERQRTGRNTDHAGFTAAELTRIVNRMDFEAQFLVNKPSPPPLPDKFVSFGAKWRKFYEGFRGHLSVLRGCMNIPLVYVVRGHVEVTDVMQDANTVYASSDARLIATVTLQGDEYEQDNKRV